MRFAGVVAPFLLALAGSVAAQADDSSDGNGLAAREPIVAYKTPDGQKIKPFRLFGSTTGRRPRRSVDDDVDLAAREPTIFLPGWKPAKPKSSKKNAQINWGKRSSDDDDVDLAAREPVSSQLHKRLLFPNQLRKKRPAPLVRPSPFSRSVDDDDVDLAARSTVSIKHSDGSSYNPTTRKTTNRRPGRRTRRSVDDDDVDLAAREPAPLRLAKLRPLTSSRTQTTPLKIFKRRSDDDDVDLAAREPKKLPFGRITNCGFSSKKNSPLGLRSDTLHRRLLTPAQLKRIKQEQELNKNRRPGSRVRPAPPIPFGRSVDDDDVDLAAREPVWSGGVSRSKSGFNRIVHRSDDDEADLAA